MAIAAVRNGSPFSSAMPQPSTGQFSSNVNCSVTATKTNSFQTLFQGWKRGSGGRNSAGSAAPAVLARRTYRLTAPESPHIVPTNLWSHVPSWDDNSGWTRSVKNFSQAAGVGNEQ